MHLAAHAAVVSATRVYLRYEGEVGGGTDNHALTVGLRLSWQKRHGMRVASGSVKITGMWRQVLPAGLLVAAAACAVTPMHWEKPGTADAAKDLAECRAEAHEEAIRQLPYGNGPPFYGAYKEMSMLQWKLAIDDERYYLEEDLTKACMLSKGFALVAGAA